MIDPIQLPAEFVPIARHLWRCIRGEFGPWEVVFDGKTLSVSADVAPDWLKSIAVECGPSLLRVLRGDAPVNFGDKGIRFLRPCLGILASDTLTHEHEANLPQFYVIAPRVTDPVAHHLIADDDGNFTLKLRTRLIGKAFEVRILL